MTDELHQKLRRELLGKSFLTTASLSPDSFRKLIQLAIQLKSQKGKLQPTLAGKTVGLIFFNPSLRTRCSMAVAITRLGGTPVPIDVGSNTWGIEYRDGVIMDADKSEHIKEAAAVLSSYFDIIGIRSFPQLKDYNEDKQDPILNKFAEFSKVPIINLESALNHPCQALADMMTIKERLGSFKKKKVVLTWAYHPRVLPMAVPNSFLLASAQCGLDLTIAAPKEYRLDPQIIDQGIMINKESGGSINITDDPNLAYDDAHIIYAKSWGSWQHYGNQGKDQQIRESYKNWQVTDQKMEKTDQGAFMHCLPVRRNIVVSDSVIDSNRSIVVAQAENRLHGQTALLSCMGN